MGLQVQLPGVQQITNRKNPVNDEVEPYCSHRKLARSEGITTVGLREKKTLIDTEFYLG